MVRGKPAEGRTRIVVEPRVVEFMLANRGRIVTISELMSALPPGAHDASVRNVMRRLMERMDISVISAGNSWRLEADTKPDISEKANPDAGKSLGLFEQVGEMQDGSLVVRDEENRLYALKAL